MKKRLYWFTNDEITYGANPDMVAGSSDLLFGDCTGLTGDCSGLSGDCSGFTGDCTGLYGDCSHLMCDLDSCGIGIREREMGLEIDCLIMK